MVLGKNIKFLIADAILLSLSLIYLTLKIRIPLLFTKKVNILVKYLDFINVFFEKISLKTI